MYKALRRHNLFPFINQNANLHLPLIVAKARKADAVNRSLQGPLQAKVGQASVGTAVAHSHYCSSTGFEKKKNRGLLLPTTWPLCHACTLCTPATHTQDGLVAPGGTTRWVLAPVTCGRAKQRGALPPKWEPGSGVEAGVRARMGGYRG